MVPEGLRNINSEGHTNGKKPYKQGIDFVAISYMKFYVSCILIFTVNT